MTESNFFPVQRLTSEMLIDRLQVYETRTSFYLLFWLFFKFHSSSQLLRAIFLTDDDEITPYKAIKRV